MHRRTLLKFLGAAGAARLPLYSAAAAAPASIASMRISRAEAIPVSIPWDVRVRDSSVTNWRRENMDVPSNRFSLVRLTTDEGLTGVGIGGSSGAVKSMIGHSPWEYVLDDRAGGALMAVYDILGQAVGLPICALFAANPRRRIVPAWWSLSYPPPLIASEAKLGYSRGYRVHKVKARPWEDAVAQADAICAAVPGDYRVWADANFFWGSVGRTIDIGVRLARHPNYFGLESPINRGYLEGYRQLKGRVPLQMAEHLGVIDTAAAIREGLLDAFILAGPLGRSMFQANAIANFYGKQLWIENSCWTGIGQVFQAHLAAAFPAIAYSICCAQISEDDFVAEPLNVEDGFYYLPQKPGLGVTVDQAALDKYRVG